MIVLGWETLVVVFVSYLPSNFSVAIVPDHAAIVVVVVVVVTVVAVAVVVAAAADDDDEESTH